nr:hypothetical protein BaRGS_024872 [Batillaria attramentaria]
MLREVKILESDPTAPDNLRKSDNSRVFRDELERESLRFAFQDGGIPDICPSEGEETWTLNVKRGFLSVFQNRKREIWPTARDPLSTALVFRAFSTISSPKFFLDALSAAGTDASVRMLTRLMVSGDVTGTDVVFWLMPLTFLPRPSPSMLQTVKNLLESKHVWREALLPVSGLVNNYCRRHRNCDSDPDVQRIMLTLKRIVGNQCHASHPNVEKIVLGVRAIANSGQAGHVAEVLDNCLKRKNNPTEVRVSAAQALRRIPCDAKRQRLWRVFGDQAEDSELRTAAYVTIMQCVTQEVLHGVQRTLAGEKDLQVVSYVYTHLANLKVKDGSYRQEMSELMETLKVNRSMSDMGGFQTSRNLAVAVTNKKQEVSVKVSATQGVAVTYSLAAGTFMSVTGRGSPKVEVNPFFFLNTPSRQLISLTGRGDYRKDRMFRADVKLSVDGLRPLELQYALIKTPTRKLDRYRLDFAVRSSVAMVTCDANVDVKPGHMLNARVTLTHNVPTVMPADTVVMVMKLNDRSASSSLNYIVAFSQIAINKGVYCGRKMESTTYPDHSFDLKLTTEHRPKDSRTRLLVKYGDDHVQYALLNSKIKHDVTDIYTVALATKTDVQVPARSLFEDTQHAMDYATSVRLLSSLEGAEILNKEEDGFRNATTVDDFANI